ncbi:DUF4202 domain-containing protein [Olivibacter sp. XZL3]|uniref:DUF4202 domain-containing protein n=1 Tax=Olivibacter sp. XZL3 TaxID=1735116 RepID=UPI0010667FB3|nr:DUF4202 domain-containing protein [Olivibacter sp. XZL3]
MNDKQESAFALFDAYNKRDPNRIEWEGQTYPEAYFFAIKLHYWIKKLAPQAGEALLLASRCQHIGRWEISRDEFPQDREGYLKWRKQLAIFHAEKAKDILVEVGYSTTLINDVQEIILKKRIKVNADVQTMENALCLVFLAYQYEAFYPRHRDKIVNILRKSLLKMDEHGHSFALSLPYSPEALSYVKEALASIGKAQ